MIISRTPLRISFAGGGTDIGVYYKHGYGAVTSTAINKYIYITVNHKFDDQVRVKYSQTELVDDASEIKHPLIREVLKLVDIHKGIEITSMADIPASGSGLGSSSSYTVGLLNALYAHKGQVKSPKTLAEEACKIEIEILDEPIGKQDQYIAAFGGMQHIRFNSDESVFVDPVICPLSVKHELESRMLLFYTGKGREARTILKGQTEKISANLDNLEKMKRQAVEIRAAIQDRNFQKFGETLHEGWMIKRGLSHGISSLEIDEWYEKARAAGALGGKILGAGGGGFLLIYAEKEHHDNIRKALSNLQLTQFKFESQGTKIIYVEDPV
jgi:D-glycero-alpha-D-manno-heptose-7-phosphate kinase